MGGGVILDDVELLHERMTEVLVGICTEDFSELHDLVALLGQLGVRFIIAGPDETVNTMVDCLILDERVGSPCFAVEPASVVPLDPDPLLTVDRALASSWGLSDAKVLTVGIDPGSRPGVAYLLDGRLVAVIRTSSVQALIGNVIKRRRAFRAKRTVVKVGNGDPVTRDEIITSLRRVRLKPVVVDERNTTRSKRHRDEMAAIQIARSEGYH
jgi:hypothetical protein